MKKLLFLAIISVFAFTACNQNKTDKGAEEAAIDTTAVQNETLEAEEVKEMTDLVNSVSACLDSIQLQEHMIFNNKENNNKQKVLAQLSSFKELLARKQSEINALLAKNKSANGENAQAKKTIQNLQNIIEFLNNQLAEKDEQISNLEKQIYEGKVKYNDLSSDYSNLEEEKNYLAEQNDAQDAQLNTVYYVSASKKDLKAAGLLKTGLFSKKVLTENIDNSKFTKADKRSLKKITINSKSPKILTNNPSSSYTLSKNADGTSTLQITDPSKFWNASSYLIIQE